MRLTKGPPLYPILLAVFPALSLYVYNITQVQLKEAILTVLLLALLAGVVLYCIYFLLRDRHKSAIITAIFFLLLFSYGHLNKATSYLFNALGVLDKTRSLLKGELADGIWLTTWLVLLVVFILVFVKYRKDLSFASRILSLCAVVAVLSVLINLGWIRYQQPTNQIDQFISGWMDKSSTESVPRVGGAADPLPDIYYIILDGMCSEETLNKDFQGDLSGFRSYLEEKGFFIADQSWSNYGGTDLSLASSLNFMYLEELRRLGPDTSNLTPLEVMIENNRLFNALHTYGYQTVTFSDEFDLTDITSSDIYLVNHHWVLNAFQNEVVNLTPLPALTRIFSFKTPADLHREQVLFLYENLFQAQDSGKPRIVFAHFMVPHPPYVFGPNGEALDMGDNYTINVRIEDIGWDNFINGYRDQVHFATTRLIPELDKILNQSNRPVILVIQGDHGPGLYYDWNSLENARVDKRMGIFNAYYFYDKDYRLLTRDISPVNTFRVILDQYFGADLPLLENRSHYTRIYHPYDFQDVTGHK